MKRVSLFLALAIMVLFSSCGEKQNYDVIIETEYGTMKVLLYDETPKHKKNFLKLASEGFYNDLLFHRVIDGFMIQGGDPNSKNAAAGTRLGMGSPGYTVPAETGFPHFRGTLAGARGGSPDSNGSQFYIVQGYGPIAANKLPNKGYTQAQKDLYAEIGGRPDLDNSYTVFGEVVEGLEIVDKIAKVNKDGSDRPLQDVKMKVYLP